MIAQLSEELVWSQLVARAWDDADFMQRLLSDPRAVLTENGLEGPPGTEVEVVLGTEVKVADADGVRLFVLSAGFPDELIEEDLVGDAVAWYCGACGRCGACGCRCRC